ncbi:MAG: glycosyltransferase family 4 protein [Chitinophagaceae bacterium]|nr:glycosyltransferase family 4 protein [Chitinophagaceae bacterium]
MKLAFYYHIPAVQRADGIYLPSYLGVFIDSLAGFVFQLHYLFHEAGKDQDKECDYRLESKNIQFVSLGPKSPAWHRMLFHGKILKNALKSISACDVLLVRSPTPLAPYFYKYFPSVKICFMIVGDYAESISHMNTRHWRNKLIYEFLKRNDILFKKQISQSHILVNSENLYQLYQGKCKAVDQIRTTTLSAKDVFIRKDTCTGPFIQLLYTGRIDPAKGMFEMIDALHQLRKLNLPVRLNIVGWETSEGIQVVSAMKEKALQLKVSEDLIFHGRKTVGESLNEMYRMADIYIIPSYHEGFPRTIWEAMAAGLPVIATKVGGIPKQLRDRVDALLIEPRDVSAITGAVLQVMNDATLRQNLIKNGYPLAMENTLEKQNEKMIEILKTRYLNG